MSAEGTTFLSRISERVLSWIALGLVVAAGVGLWQMGPEARAALWSGAWRSVAWLAIVAAVPWSGALFIRRLGDVGSNWVGVALLASLTVVDILAGAALLTAWPSGVWTWLAAMTLLALAGAYNFLVSEYLADRAGV